MISVYLLLDFDPSRKQHPDSRDPMPVGESGSRRDRLWEQTRPPLGADTTASGSRHDRLWDVTRTSLGRRSLKNNGFGAEGKVLHLPKYVVWAKRKR